MKLATAAGALAAVLLLEPSAGAQSSPKVLIVVPATSSETATRLHAELASAGFEAVTGDEPIVVRPGALGDAARAANAAAGVRVGQGADRLTALIEVEIAPPDAAPIRRRIEVQGAPAELPRVAAIRAVELLRGSLAEAYLATLARPTPPESAAPVAPPAAPGLYQGWHVAAGAGLSHGVGGVGPVLDPVLGIGRGVAPGLAARTVLIGPGGAAVLVEEGGQAELRAISVIAEAVLVPRAPGRLLPLARAGVGAHRLGIRGVALPPNEAHDGAIWSGLVAGGAGVALRLGDHLAVTLEATASALSRPAVIRIGGRDAGTFRAVFGLHATVVARWGAGR